MTITREDLDLGRVDFSDLDLTGERIEPVPPGEILRDVLGRREILPFALAAAMGVHVNRITAIIRGERAITADTAIRLGLALGTSPDLWLGLQDAYDLALARSKGVGAGVRSLPAVA
jgi:antitoxin HigA-1